MYKKSSIILINLITYMLSTSRAGKYTFDVVNEFAYLDSAVTNKNDVSLGDYLAALFRKLETTLIL